jgi:hypothetical protein
MHPSSTAAWNCGHCPQPSIGTRFSGAWLSLRLRVFAPLRCVLPRWARPFQESWAGAGAGAGAGTATAISDGGRYGQGSRTRPPVTGSVTVAMDPWWRGLPARAWVTSVRSDGRTAGKMPTAPWGASSRSRSRTESLLGTGSSVAPACFRVRLRLAALRWREALVRETRPGGSPVRACGSRAPLKENRPAFARRAAGGCPAPVPRIPGVRRRRHSRRCARSRVAQWRRLSFSVGPTGAATILEDERKRPFSNVVLPPRPLSEGSGHLSPNVSPSGFTIVTSMTETDVRDRPTISSGTGCLTEACLHASVEHRGLELRALPAAIDRYAFQWRMALFAPSRLCAFALSVLSCVPSWPVLSPR